MTADMGFVQGKNDLCVYYNPKTGLRVGAHVDDCMTRGKRHVSRTFWEDVATRFAVKHWGFVEEGEPKVYCGMEVSKETKDGTTWYIMDQARDIRQFLEDEQMEAVRGVQSPMPEKNALRGGEPVTKEQHKWVRSTVGSLSYFAVTTQYPIAQAVNRVAQFLEKPTTATVTAIKRIMGYLASNKDIRLRVPRVEGTTWDVFTDSDHAGDRLLGTTSRTGVIILCNGCPVHWRSNKQPVTSVSSAAAEIYALSEGVKDARLVMWCAEEMKITTVYPIQIGVDNAAGVSFQNSTNMDTRLKGIFDLREEWVVELRDMAVIKAVKISTLVNVADILTKCQPRGVIHKLMRCVSDRAAGIASRV